MVTETVTTTHYGIPWDTDKGVGNDKGVGKGVGNDKEPKTIDIDVNIEIIPPLLNVQGCNEVGRDTEVQLVKHKVRLLKHKRDKKTKIGN